VWKLTAQHFGPNGICPNGHRLEIPLVDRLTAWIKAEGIEGNYAPDQIAARVVAQLHPSYLTRLLDEGSDHLRDMCTRIKDFEDLTDEEFAAENYRHGHGQRPGVVRIGEVVND
jgi:hypothetical protein